MKNILIAPLFIASLNIFAQTPDEYDHELFCFNSHPYLKDNYILFNEGDDSSWVMEIEEDPALESWKKAPMEEQPDRWVIETLNIQDQMIWTVNIPKKISNGEQRISRQIQEFTATPENKINNVMPCFINRDIIKRFLNEPEVRKMTKQIYVDLRQLAIDALSDKKEDK